MLIKVKSWNWNEKTDGLINRTQRPTHRSQLQVRRNQNDAQNQMHQTHRSNQRTTQNMDSASWRNAENHVKYLFFKILRKWADYSNNIIAIQCFHHVVSYSGM